MSKIKIAIDGPSAVGKGSVTDRLAQKLNLVAVHTGDMYRVVALCSMGDINTAIEIANNFTKYWQENYNNPLLYTQENTTKTSQIATNSEVRKGLVCFQKKLAQDGGVVMEGRDICSVVMPDAHVKVYLDATAEERARRRFLQSGGVFEDILQAIKERDERDKNRADSPLVITTDAIYIDSSLLSIDGVCDVIIKNLRT